MTNPPATVEEGQLDRCRRYCWNYKKLTVAASLTTMLYCVMTVGLLISELMDISDIIDKYGVGSGEEGRPRVARAANSTAGESDPDIDDAELYVLTISKVMYTALICELVLLLISSVALLRGLYQKRQSLIMTWILIILATIIYSGAVVIRDFHQQGNTSRNFIALAIYVVFIFLESNFIKPVVTAFREVRRLTILRHSQNNSAVFDPRHPRDRVFTIADNLEPQTPETLFKLPSYDEVTSTDLDAAPGTSDPRGKPPPYEPPPYQP